MGDNDSKTANSETWGGISDQNFGFDREPVTPEQLVSKIQDNVPANKVVVHVATFNIMESSEALKYEELMTRVYNNYNKYSVKEINKVPYQKTGSFVIIVEYFEKIGNIDT
jgi:hypothetical protein